MAKQKRRSFTAEYRAEVVELIRRGDRSVGEICRSLDLTESAVRRWVEKAPAMPGEPVGPLTKTERAELTALRREIKTLRMEREILKKATAFFAKENA
jgi:transposase